MLKSIPELLKDERLATESKPASDNFWREIIMQMNDYS